MKWVVQNNAQSSVKYLAFDSTIGRISLLTVPYGTTQIYHTETFFAESTALCITLKTQCNGGGRRPRPGKTDSSEFFSQR